MGGKKRKRQPTTPYKSQSNESCGSNVDQACGAVSLINALIHLDAPAEKEGDEDTEELLQALLDESADEEEVAPTEVQWRAEYGSGVVPADVQWLLQQSETEKEHYWLRMAMRKSAKSGYLFKEADGTLTWKGGDTLLYHNDKFDRELDDKFVKQESKPEPAGDRGSKRVKVKQEPKPEPAGDRGGKRAKSESYSKPSW